MSTTLGPLHFSLWMLFLLWIPHWRKTSLFSCRIEIPSADSFGKIGNIQENMSGIKRSYGFFTHSFACGFWNERVRLVGESGRHPEMRMRRRRPAGQALCWTRGHMGRWAGPRCGHGHQLESRDRGRACWLSISSSRHVRFQPEFLVCLSEPQLFLP